MNENKTKFNLNDKNIENISNNDNKGWKRKIPKEFLIGKNILSRKKIVIWVKIQIISEIL